MAGKTSLTTAELDIIDDYDSSAVRWIFEFFTQTDAGVPLPRVCLEKTVCADVFSARLNQVGKRYDGWKERAVNLSTGQIDWAIGGCYSLRWSTDGIASHIVHCGTGHEVEVESYQISKDWKIVDNVHDLQTKLVKGLLRYSAQRCSGTRRGRMSTR